MKSLRSAILTGTALLVSACGSSPGATYTLYGNLPASGQAIRVHVATFDANEREAYNLENCETAARLFQTLRRDTGRYWCEKGRFRK